MDRKNFMGNYYKWALMAAPVLCGFNACTSAEIQSAFRSGITATLNGLFGVVSNAIADGIVG